MYSKGRRLPVTNQGSLPSPQNTSPSDSETDMTFELDQKRRQIDEEIANFQAQKEKEFRDFERELRASRRRRNSSSPPPMATSNNRGGLGKPPSRTSSSSALNLLAGRGAPKPSQFSKTSRQNTTESLPQSKISTKSSPALSQPVVSLDKLTIKGENAVPQSNRPKTPPTPTLLSKSLTRPSSGSPTEPSSSQTKQQSASKDAQTSLPLVSPEEDIHRNSFTGLFTPSFIRLIDSDTDAPIDSSSSALETPPAEDAPATAPSSYKTNLLSEILPMSASSFPPCNTASPGSHSHASKRAYTAPTVSKHRAPSALRTASGGALGRKAKHVTLRLADSAIVEPSSSYEEGPSPQYEDGKPQTSTSGTRNPLKANKSQLNKTLSPDEEDEEAGVRPGMGMGDVIQRLNEFTVAEAAKHGEDLVLEVDESELNNEDNGVDDEDDDDEDGDGDDDMPMEIMSRHQENLEDDSDRHLEIEYHEHEDDEDESSDSEAEMDGYFSPKAKHVSSISSLVPRGNSPLVPYREYNWAELSSSDKDRLLFEARRHSDDGDDARQRSIKNVSTPTFDENGFSAAFKQNIDGGSGVGFFELDEELNSPDAGDVRPFEFEVEVDEPDTAEKLDNKNEINTIGLGLSTTTPSKKVGKDNEKRWSNDSASKFGVGSVPIDIVRPSMSVTSSWVGTFGH